VALLPPQQFFNACADQAATAALLEQPEWALAVHNPGPEPVWLTGWQNHGPADRALQGASDGLAYPAVELRLVRADDGYLEFAAF
jgi:hypothetical protein